MAITALHSAATGLGALSTQIDVIANNLANVPTVGADFSVSQDGTVEVATGGTSAKSRVGHIQLAPFIPPQGLKLLGGTLFIETEPSGRPLYRQPETPAKVNFCLVPALRHGGRRERSTTR